MSRTTRTRRTVLKSLGAAGAAAALPLTPADAHAADAVSLPLDWNAPATTSVTTPTLQVVVNPAIRRESPVHDAVYRALGNLHTDYVRFVPWFPYPKLGVAELEAPADSRTSWDFSLIDPLVEDFAKATRDRSTILNFSTIPEWMWQNTPWTVQDGALHVTGGDNGIAASGTDWTDYTVTTAVTPLATALHNGAPYAQAGWLVRMRDPRNGYGFLLSNYPYSSPAAAGYIVFVVFEDGGVSSVRATELPWAVEPGTPYQVRTRVSGDELAVTVAGTDVLTVHDSTFAAGTVGFREHGSESAVFDDVAVTAAGGQTLLTDDFSDAGLSRWTVPVVFPEDPDTPVWNYSQGRHLAVPVSEVADYYRRLVSWYTAGGFTDEYGTFHRSPHHYRLPYWEVLNEPDLEHSISPQDYTKLYDAIVTAIREVSPRTRFVGLALADAGSLDYYRYFLDRDNHAPGVPLDLISYHFYARPGADDTADDYGPTCFPQADRFIGTVGQIEEIRTSLAPATRTTVNELGTILPGAATQADPAPIPDAYWNFSGGLYAYVFARLALLGIDIVGESQLMGHPGQYPSVSLLDWTTGEPNARYRVLQLLLAEIRPGCGLTEIAGMPSDSLYVLGVTADDRRKLLMVNKTNSPVPVRADGLRGARVRIVDQQSAGGDIRDERSTDDTFTLGGYAVAVATLATGR
jgi:Glycosyl hydrolases family 39